MTTTLVAVFLAAIFATLALADDSSRDVWCLQPDNLEKVVVSAEVQRLGVGAGADGQMIDPKGGGGAISLRAWLRQSPADFHRACDDAYEGNFGLAGPDPAEPDSDGESALAKLGLATVPVLLGAGAGFGLSKLSRGEERRHQRTVLLRDGLTDLMTELDQLIAKVPSEAVEGDDKLAVRRRAAQLLSQIPPSSSSGEEAATTALYDLIATLAEPKQDPDPETTRLTTAKTEVKEAVEQLISSL